MSPDQSPLKQSLVQAKQAEQQQQQQQQQQQPASQPAENVAEGELGLEATADHDSHAALLQPDTHNAATRASSEVEYDSDTQPTPVHVGIDSTSLGKPAHALDSESKHMHVSADDPDDEECVICWEAKSHVRMQPCGHMCVCSGCAAMLRDPLCPMCRCKVLSRLTVRL